MKRVEKYAGNLNFNDFLKNEIVQDAVVRNLEVIGEAAKKIPEEIKGKHPKVEWKKITNLEIRLSMRISV